MNRTGWQIQGRQEHGWWGHGTSAEKISDATPIEDSAQVVEPSSLYIAQNPKQWLGQRSIGNGQCVALVQRATGE